MSVQYWVLACMDEANSQHNTTQTHKHTRQDGVALSSHGFW